MELQLLKMVYTPYIAAGDLVNSTHNGYHSGNQTICWGKNCPSSGLLLLRRCESFSEVGQLMTLIMRL